MCTTISRITLALVRFGPRLRSVLPSYFRAISQLRHLSSVPGL
jgi:hypothetical protein